MASGKTTMLQALATLMPPDYRSITIEDVPELRLPHTHWDTLYTRKGYTIGASKLDIDLFELTKFLLRRRGQYIIVGEVRGKEVQSLVQAAATGQGPACTILHNGSCRGIWNTVSCTAKRGNTNGACTHRISERRNGVS